MQHNEHVDGGFGDFEFYGGHQSFCDMVGTCGIYVEGNAAIAATTGFISRQLLLKEMIHIMMPIFSQELLTWERLNTLVLTRVPS